MVLEVLDALIVLLTTMLLMTIHVYSATPLFLTVTSAINSPSGHQSALTVNLPTLHPTARLVLPAPASSPIAPIALNSEDTPSTVPPANQATSPILQLHAPLATQLFLTVLLVPLTTLEVPPA